MSEITAEQAAKILGVTRHRVYILAEEGTLKGYKQHNRWHIYKDSLMEYQYRSEPKMLTEINGERVYLAWEFAQKHKIPYSTYQDYISSGKLITVIKNHRRYITESNMKQFLKRETEREGRKVVGIDKAAEITGHYRNWISRKIARGELEFVVDGNKKYVFLDSLAKLMEREKRMQGKLFTIQGTGIKRSPKSAEEP